MGMQFQYDEAGTTFYYFVVSFYALILLPVTIFLLKGKKSKKDAKEGLGRCHCEGCQAKLIAKKAAEPWMSLKTVAIRIGLVLAWLAFFYMAYRVSLIEVDHKEYDPFEILGIDAGAEVPEIKKRYRELSKTHHPDRGGDAKQFDLIAKAYQALTDEEAKENWEKYGNPDGPGVTQFGIALPKWLVSKEYGLWVLAAYGLVFMVILPSVVGVWWYNSIKYSADKVLMDTTQIYGHFLQKTPNMQLKRVLMVVAASFEFSKFYNKDIVERESDNVEVAALMKHLPNLQQQNKEKPLCYPYSLKARALIHAHLTRIPLRQETLDKDRLYAVKRCPLLIQELISMANQMVWLHTAGRFQRCPSIETLDNMLKTTSMVVQATWDSRSSLYQLPHFTDDMVRYTMTKTRRLRSCADVAYLDETERSSFFRSLSDEQYHDVIEVLKMMPRVGVECSVEVQGEEDKHEITAGSLATVKVQLTRTPLLPANYEPGSQHLNRTNDKSPANGKTGQQQPKQRQDDSDNEAEQQKNGDNGDDNQDEDGNAQQQSKRKPWEKQKKKKGGGKASKNKSKPKPQTKKPPSSSAKKEDEKAGGGDDDDTASVSQHTTPRDKRRPKRSKRRNDDNSDDDVSAGSGSDDWSGSDDDSASLNNRRKENADDSDGGGGGEDDDDIVFNDELTRRDLVLETKSKQTHPVHCPYFPEQKFEWWYVYLFDKKLRKPVSGPIQCTTLVDQEEVELKFPAPPKPGQYTYTVAVRSDSYLDCDVNKDVKLTVLEAREVTSHPQWDFPSDEEDDKKSEEEHSSAYDYTEGEEEEDDD